MQFTAQSINCYDPERFIKEKDGEFLLEDLDYYQLLGIHNRENVTRAQIATCYRKKAKLSHPDRGGNQKEFDLYKKAFDTLIVPANKAKYDKRLSKSHKDMQRESKDMLNDVRADKEEMQKLAKNISKKGNKEKFNTLFEKHRKKINKKYGDDNDVDFATEKFYMLRDNDKLDLSRQLRSESKDTSDLKMMVTQNKFVPYYDANIFNRHFNEMKKPEPKIDKKRAEKRR